MEGKLCAAAYCRVSTDRKEQANSFAAQQRYFREYLSMHPQWTLYRIYADEGLSGTSTKKREAFQAMLRDAETGCFQVLLTKEVSRFSRNILDTIACSRQLRQLGVRVIFLQDGIDTMEPDAELRLSILGTIAQEESRRISARVKWGQTRQMERGVVFGRALLGYDLQDGVLTVNADGAAVVRKIFSAYAEQGMSAAAVARMLEQEQIPTLRGGSGWTAGQVLKILRNEKYAGDLLQKKTYTPDYLSHDKKPNHGQEEKIFLPQHHEPLVSRQLWEAAQTCRKQRRRNGGSKPSVAYSCSGKIFRGLCGSRFVHKTKHRSDGTAYGCWYCGKAAAHGRKGCGIGITLRQDRAEDMVLRALRERGGSVSEDKDDMLKRYLNKMIVQPNRTVELWLEGCKEKCCYSIKGFP